MEEALPLSRKLLGPEHPITVIAMDNLANSYYKASRSEEARKLLEEALPLNRKLKGPERSYTPWVMKTLADSYAEAPAWQRGGVALLEESCRLNPKDTDASLTLATWQTWFGRDADYEATRHRLIQEAEGTDQAGTAERAAKAACIRPSTDSALLTKALNLAHRGVELGKTNSALPWYQMSLGLAEYRNGQYSDAEQTLADLESKLGGFENAKTAFQFDIEGTARLFRAMSLFRRQRAEEALRLFMQTEARAPSLPKDTNKPIVDGKPFDRDLLVMWLAYEEAKALIEPPSAPVAARSAPK